MLRRILIFMICFITIGSCYAITIDELINSYNFSHEDKDFNLNEFNVKYNNSNIINESFDINLDFDNKYGNYLILLDFYIDHNEINKNKNEKNTKIQLFRVFKKKYLVNGKNSVNFTIPIKYNFSSYDVKLKFYKDGNLVFREYYENKIELENFIISNNSCNISNMICVYNNQSEINNKIFYIGYEEQKDFNSQKVEKLIFNFESLVKDGEYLAELYINNKVFYNELKIENENFNFEINSEDIYDYKLYGDLKLEKLLLKKENKIIQGIVLNQTTIFYNLEDFRIPNLPDLKFVYVNYSQNISNNTMKYINISLVNNGSMNAFGILYKLLNKKFEIIEEKRIMRLDINTTYFIGSFNISNIYALVDYEYEVIEQNETNNIFIWPIPIKEESTLEVNINSNENSNVHSGSSRNSKLSNNRDNINSIKNKVYDSNSKINKFNQNIKDNHTINQIKKKLKLKESYLVEYDNETIDITLLDIKEDYIIILINNQSYTLYKNKSKLIDIDEDNNFDYRLTYNNILDNQIELIIDIIDNNIFDLNNDNKMITPHKNNYSINNTEIEKRINIEKKIIKEEDMFSFETLGFIGILVSSILALFFLI